MPRKLTDAISAPEVQSLGAGKHADGGGLYLIVKPRADSTLEVQTWNRSWLFTYRSGGKVREMGLGSAQGKFKDRDKDWSSLATARDKARNLRAEVRAGMDPLATRAAERVAERAAAQSEAIASITFEAAATAYMDDHDKGLRNAKHRAQWRSTLKTYVYPIFGQVAVRDVSTAHVMDVLKPIWGIKTETGTRVRGRIEAVLDYAKSLVH